MRDIIYITDHLTPRKRREVQAREFLKPYGVTLEAMRGKRQTQEFVTARWALMRYLVDVLCMGYAEAGRFLNKHHTTVMYGVAQERFATNHTEAPILHKARRRKVARTA